MANLFGGMEGGGTKFVCIIGTRQGKILDEVRFPTTTYNETLKKTVSFFKKHKPKAIGLAPFGPLDLSRDSPSYGSITNTPKPGWSGVNILLPFRQELNVPLAFDLDVNAAAYGEYAFVPENYPLESLAYITIGTGIGAGFVTNGHIVHGLTHPEAGHMRLPHDWNMDPFPGICPFHGDCLEGLASGTALESRTGVLGAMIPDDHPVWTLEARYIALGVLNIILTISPQRIILGGGVMKRNYLYPMIRHEIQELLNGYVDSPYFSENLGHYIVSPGLGNRSGTLGALAMAITAYEDIHD